MPLGYPTIVAYAPSRDLYATTDGSTVRLWDPGAQQVVARLEGHTDELTALAFSSDGNRLATGGLDNRMLLWELEHQPVVGRAFEGHTSQVEAVQFLERQPLIASGGRDGRVILWPASPEAWRQALCRRAGGGASEAELLRYQPGIATGATACASGGSG